jgi:transposase
MLALTAGYRYFIYRGVTDFRCGMDRLCGLVRQQLLAEPTGGDIYIFFNRRRTQLKLLHFEGDGFGLYHKRLEAGTYELPEAAANATSMELSSEELMLILRGIQLKSIARRKRFSWAEKTQKYSKK